MQDGVNHTGVLTFSLRVTSKAGTARVSALVTSGLFVMCFVNQVLDDVRYTKPPPPLGMGVVCFLHSVICQEVAAIATLVTTGPNILF